MQEHSITSIPLNLLEPSGSNVRQANAGKEADAELKASIRAHGLLQNLIVYKLEAYDEEHIYTVIAGNRRLVTLKELADEGHLPHDAPILCRIHDKHQGTREASLAENVVRVALHPADQVEVFAKLIQGGMTVKKVATNFGVSRRVVEQRLKLGSVAPEILQAFRENKLNSETVMAYTLTPDHARQVAIFKAEPHAGSWTIKNALLDEKVSGNSAIARFVGVREYKKAGGTITRDLFSDQHDPGSWFNDGKILHDLAHKKLSKTRQGLSAGWKWYETHPEFGYDGRKTFDTLFPTPDDFTTEEAARIEALRKEIETLDDPNGIREWELDQEINMIDSAARQRGAYTAEQMAVSGCVVTLNRDAKPEVLRGLVKPADRAAASKLQPLDLDHEREPGSAAKEAREEAGVGDTLADDLRDLRRNIVRFHLAGDFQLAFDLLTFQIARAAFKEGHYFEKPLDINLTVTEPCPHRRRDNQGFTLADQGTAKFRAACERLPLEWIGDTGEGAFAKFQALPLIDRQALFTAAVACALKGQLSLEAHPESPFEAVTRALGIDFAAEFRPTAFYWKQLKKEELLKVARSTLGAEWVDGFASAKKGELVAALEAAFAADDASRVHFLLPAAREKALAWSPPGFEPASLKE